MDLETSREAVRALEVVTNECRESTTYLAELLGVDGGRFDARLGRLAARCDALVAVLADPLLSTLSPAEDEFEAALRELDGPEFVDPSPERADDGRGSAHADDPRSLQRAYDIAEARLPEAIALRAELADRLVETLRLLDGERP